MKYHTKGGYDCWEDEETNEPSKLEIIFDAIIFWLFCFFLVALFTILVLWRIQLW